MNIKQIFSGKNNEKNIFLQVMWAVISNSDAKLETVFDRNVMEMDIYIIYVIKRFFKFGHNASS